MTAIAETFDTGTPTNDTVTTRREERLMRLLERASASSRFNLGERWLFALGGALVIAGFVVVLIGWAGASRTVLVAGQIPYLISGGMIGLGLVFLGGFLYFGHWVAAGNVGGTPMQFLQKYHDRISSFHLKDRTTPEHCSLNLAWGTGETPIKDILQMVSKNKWKIPASIELEYQIPESSDAVKETKKCVDYCRAALTGSSPTSASR